MKGLGDKIRRKQQMLDLLDHKYKEKIADKDVELQRIRSEIQTQKKIFGNTKSKTWMDLEYDYRSQTLLGYKDGVFGFTVVSIDGIEIMAEFLGYNEIELAVWFDCGKHYSFGTEHPIFKIVNKATKDDWSGWMDYFEKIFELITSAFGLEFIMSNLVYRTNDRKLLKAVGYHQIKPMLMNSNLVVRSKIKILDQIN